MASHASVIQKAIRRMRNLLPRKPYVQVAGSLLAPPERRWCDAEFKDDHFYLSSAEGEARRLMTRLHCTPTTRILDVGCGQGRLAIGLLRVLGELDYIGVDVHRPSIAWCQAYIERYHPSFRFHHIDVYNARYNPTGSPIERNFRFAVE